MVRQSEPEKETAMFAKKIICTLSAGALLATALPALAAPPYWVDAHGRRAHERVVVERERTIVVRHEPRYYARPRYVEPVYSPAPVYAPARVYAEPVYNEPVYAPAYGRREPNPVGAIGGAAIGAAIGSQMGHGDARTAGAAVGAILGGIIGSNF
jgi:uncharacterized protein YcfJ